MFCGLTDRLKPPVQLTHPHGTVDSSNAVMVMRGPFFFWATSQVRVCKFCPGGVDPQNGVIGYHEEAAEVLLAGTWVQSGHLALLRARPSSLGVDHLRGVGSFRKGYTLRAPSRF